mgnify:CR=1 FL=1
MTKRVHVPGYYCERYYESVIRDALRKIKWQKQEITRAKQCIKAVQAYKASYKKS